MISACGRSRRRVDTFRLGLSVHALDLSRILSQLLFQIFDFLLLGNDEGCGFYLAEITYRGLKLQVQEYSLRSKNGDEMENPYHDLPSNVLSEWGPDWRLNHALRLAGHLQVEHPAQCSSSGVTDSVFVSQRSSFEVVHHAVSLIHGLAFVVAQVPCVPSYYSHSGQPILFSFSSSRHRQTSSHPRTRPHHFLLPP